MAVIGTLLAFAGAYYSVLLFKNLRTDFEELLPTTARSVVDLAEVKSRLESIDNLSVLIFSEHPAESRKFVVDLSARLKNAPKDVIASVEYKIDEELRFFKSRQALFMDPNDLIHLRSYIRDRIGYERELYNPLNIFNGRELTEPRYDFNSLKDRYKGSLATYERFPGGFYATPDEKKRAILVYLPGGTGGIGASHRLKDEVEKAVLELKPKSYAPDIEVKYTGSVQDGLEEHAALIADLELSTVVVGIIVSFAMWIFFRNIPATIALVGSLFMGTFWTFGISYFAEGYLNANSAFLGSIVIGNGINFGIIYLARYLEERRNGRGNTRATLISIRSTSLSTMTAALAAGLSYGSLALTSFRGFKQFGVIGLIGMVLCWISAFTLMPAYLTLMDRLRPLVRRGERPPRTWIGDGMAALVSRFPRPIWYASVLLLIASIATFPRYSPDIIETNLGKLRNKASLETGSAFLSRYIDEIFQHYLSPMVILPKSLDDARKIAALLKEKQAKEGKESLIASVQMLDDFIPKNQSVKLGELSKIRRELPPKIVQRLSEQDQRRVGDFLNNAVLERLETEALPDLVLSKFREKDGSVGKLVLVEPPLTQALWVGENLMKFIGEIRETADSVAPGTPIAGGLAVTSDMLVAVSKDGPKATLFAFCAVVLLVVLLFRNLQIISLCLFSLILGMIWLAGIILGFQLKINFLNFIALPITFGIGIDYGVNIFQRYREEQAGGILKVIRNTGSAVMLCSFTTVVGYGSLLIAGNQGFVSFGRLAVAGELTCLAAALFSLPAFLLLRARKRGLA